MTSSSGARSESAASTASNRRWRAPASSAAPGWSASAAPAWRSASANGSNGASGSSEQRPSRTVAPSASAAAANSWASRVLPTPGSPASSTSRRSRCICTPAHDARRRSSSARRPTNAVAWARSSARGGATGAAGARRSSSSSARVSRDGGMPSAPRRRSAKRSPAASAAARSPALASRSIRRRFGSSASGSSATCSRVRRIASAGSAVARELLERVGEPLRVRLAGVVGPVVVEAVEDRRAARRQRGGGVAGVERRGERARVDRALERDRLAPGDELAGRRPERAAQLGQRGAQAGAGRLVEHVGPEARGELGAGVRAGVQREVGEHGAGAARGRRRELVAVRAEREPSGESDLQHDANCRALARPAQAVHATFTLRER